MSKVQTDAATLIVGDVRIPTLDGADIPCYRAMPDLGQGPFPVVLVVEEIFGVHEYIRDVCRRLAKVGYLALAPELFIRQGGVTNLEDVPKILEVVHTVPDEQVMTDLDAVVGWAKSEANQSKGDTGRLAITGFCWGGRIVWLYAAHSKLLKAGCAWYGQIIGHVNEFRPKTALEMAGSVQAPVLGLYGGKDTGIPVEQVERMQAALRAEGNASEIVVYPDAPHAFHADYRPGYREADARDGWERMLAWFRKNGA